MVTSRWFKIKPSYYVNPGIGQHWKFVIFPYSRNLFEKEKERLDDYKISVYYYLSYIYCFPFYLCSTIYPNIPNVSFSRGCRGFGGPLRKTLLKKAYSIYSSNEVTKVCTKNSAHCKFFKVSVLGVKRFDTWSWFQFEGKHGIISSKTQRYCILSVNSLEHLLLSMRRKYEALTFSKFYIVQKSLKNEHGI